VAADLGRVVMRSKGPRDPAARVGAVARRSSAPEGKRALPVFR
jgi:hypothetical protein